MFVTTKQIFTEHQQTSKKLKCAHSPEPQQTDFAMPKGAVDSMMILFRFYDSLLPSNHSHSRPPFTVSFFDKKKKKKTTTK